MFKMMKQLGETSAEVMILLTYLLLLPVKHTCVYITHFSCHIRHGVNYFSSQEK